MMKNNLQSILDYAIAILIAGMFLSIMSGQSASSIIFYVLCVFCLMNWIMHARQGAPTVNMGFGQYKTLFILCSLSLLMVLLSKGINNNLSGIEIEKAARFSLGLPLFYAGMRYVSYEKLKHAFWGVYAAIIFQFIYVIAKIWPDLSQRPDTGEIHNAVTYAVLGLIFTFMSCFSIRVPLTKLTKTELIFKLFCIVLGFITFILLQTRTGFLAFPIFIVVSTLLVFYKTSMYKKILVLLLSFLLVFGALFAIPIVQDRVELATNEFSECIAKDYKINSSICMRMQLQHAAIDLWQENIWFGTGDNATFQMHMQDQLLQEGVVTEMVANEFGEPHNDYLLQLSSFGLFGLLSFVLVYLSPAIVFFNHLRRSSSAVVRSYAAMGVVVTLGFAVFSLTEQMFRNIRTISFYCVLVAFLLLAITVYENHQKARTST